jgi:hypothetical protein
MVRKLTLKHSHPHSNSLSLTTRSFPQRRGTEEQHPNEDGLGIDTLAVYSMWPMFPFAAAEWRDWHRVSEGKGGQMGHTMGGDFILHLSLLICPSGVHV